MTALTLAELASAAGAAAGLTAVIAALAWGWRSR